MGENDRDHLGMWGCGGDCRSDPGRLDIRCPWKLPTRLVCLCRSMRPGYGLDHENKVGAVVTVRVAGLFNYGLL